MHHSHQTIVIPVVECMPEPAVALSIVTSPFKCLVEDFPLFSLAKKKTIKTERGKVQKERKKQGK